MPDREVALITGTRKGIGRSLAEHFLGAGRLVEGCSRNAADWRAEGYNHHLVDVTEEAAVKAMVSSIRKRHGRLDILVNNAGAASMNHFLLTPTEAADRLMATNYRGTFLLCREAAKVMRKRKYGRIVNLTTVAVPLHLEGEAAYVASKSAVEGLTRVIARELADLGITCNAVGPPPIETDLIRSVPDEKIGQLVDRLATKRLGTYDDVANVVDFLSRPESSSVTGQIIYLGGV